MNVKEVPRGRDGAAQDEACMQASRCGYRWFALSSRAWTMKHPAEWHALLHALRIVRRQIESSLPSLLDTIYHTIVPPEVPKPSTSSLHTYSMTFRIVHFPFQNPCVVHYLQHTHIHLTCINPITTHHDTPSSLVLALPHGK